MWIEKESAEGYSIACHCGHHYIEKAAGRYTECRRCGHSEEIDRLVLAHWQTVGWVCPASLRMSTSRQSHPVWRPLR